MQSLLTKICLPTIRWLLVLLEHINPFPSYHWLYLVSLLHSLGLSKRCLSSWVHINLHFVTDFLHGPYSQLFRSTKSWRWWSWLRYAHRKNRFKIHPWQIRLWFYCASTFWFSGQYLQQKIWTFAPD